MLWFLHSLLIEVNPMAALATSLASTDGVHQWVPLLPGPTGLCPCQRFPEPSMLPSPVAAHFRWLWAQVCPKAAREFKINMFLEDLIFFLIWKVALCKQKTRQHFAAKIKRLPHCLLSLCPDRCGNRVLSLNKKYYINIHVVYILYMYRPVLTKCCCQHVRHT